MKDILSLLLILMLGGCATPLAIDTDGGELAKALRVDKDDISFISYCTFDEIREWEKKVRPIQGVVVLVGSELRLAGGDLRNASESMEIIIPLEEIEAVGLKKFGLGRQIQIRKADHLIILEVTAKKSTIDREGSQNLFDQIVSQGVDTFETERFYTQAVPPMIFIPIY